MSNPDLWIVEVVHLGSNQIDISYDVKDNTEVMLLKWSKEVAYSSNVVKRNVENVCLHSYQHIPMSDCSQSEVTFKINIAQVYLNEGKMEFAFSLEAGVAGDSLAVGKFYPKRNSKQGTGGQNSQRSSFSC